MIQFTKTFSLRVTLGSLKTSAWDENYRNLNIDIKI